MTNEQWDILLRVIDGERVDPLPVGFIIDSPWLPRWAGMSILDYYASESRWLGANLEAVRRFPRAIFLPGFWSEWGMCTEPSAFGAKCRFAEDDFPFAEKISEDLKALAALEAPDPRTDGLCPFVLKRLVHARPAIEEAGHAIRFAVARGPLNIAGFIAGNTELLLALKLDPEAAHGLLERVTEFLVEWIRLQARAIPTIDGILILDDLVGFCGEADFEAFARPYLKRIFEAIDARVRFFHNDAKGKVCAPHLAGIGVNLFNFAFEHPMVEMKQWTGNQVALLGNIPPRDILAHGTPEDVRRAVRDQIASTGDPTRVVLSCGGGMPPGVSTENIEAFLDAAGQRA
ncbi:MAG: uroporphyrinogen decarboxylase family protein [Planctomycetes bacterium]|nr:uroporphyrinogen decarboxylase family protein [Planctomycetota bacterium]